MLGTPEGQCQSLSVTNGESKLTHGASSESTARDSRYPAWLCVSSVEYLAWNDGPKKESANLHSRAVAARASSGGS